MIQQGSIHEIWNGIVERYSTDQEKIDKCWNEIITRYSEPHRHYHNLFHIAYMVDLAGRLKDKIESYDIIIMSIVYHDIFYDVNSSNNEEASAMIAEQHLQLLGFPEDFRNQCIRQIEATKHHAESDSNDTSYLIDFDLAIMGEDWEKFRGYEVSIRKEYSSFSDDKFNHARKKILKSFLDRPRIYQTDFFFRTRETQARANIIRSLKSI